jgi:hypothetical protein
VEQRLSTTWRATAEASVRGGGGRNFTDIDDKIIKRAKETGEDPLHLSQRHAPLHLLLRWNHICCIQQKARR